VSAAAKPALCVDLDGTLVQSDMLFESVMRLIKRNPLHLLQLPLWLLRGKAVLRAEIAARVEVDPATLPYNRELLTWLEEERRDGRCLWLCTATDARLASAVAAHVGLFDGVIASDGTGNPAGEAKAARLIERFGDRGFEYCGNEKRDLAIWRHSAGAIVVNGSVSLEQSAAAVTTLLRSFPPRAKRLAALLRALRPHQWAKNILLLVPLAAAHRISDLQLLQDSLLALLVFCLGASSVYVFNDLLDLESDRLHPRKAHRPFASGALPISAGLALAPLLLVAATLISLLLPVRFQLVFAAYYVLTLAYSLDLKRRVVVDAMALAGLYTLRIIAGATAVAVPLSFWLLLFSIFLFLSLALVKRFAELDSLRRRQQVQAAGRGYRVEDAAVLQSLGTASGQISVLVLALYVNSGEVESMYTRPEWIWTLCVLLLYWISRVWMKAQRGEMHEDPVIFALRDARSLGVGLLAAIAVALAI
jgi:4-hydroxybenzoate polyprenyltransferase/phosphoserine phosphatase